MNLWDEIRFILPSEKPNNTIGRPAVPFRKVLDCIVYVLRTECQWKMIPNIVWFMVRHVIDDSNSGLHLRYFKDCGLDC